MYPFTRTLFTFDPMVQSDHVVSPFRKGTMDTLELPVSGDPAVKQSPTAPSSASSPRRVSVRLTNGQVINCDTRKVP